MIFAGTPATTQLSGISFVTTAPAAIVTLLPIVIGPITIEFAPNLIFSPNIGFLVLGFPFEPTVTPCLKIYTFAAFFRKEGDSTKVGNGGMFWQTHCPCSLYPK